MAKRLAVLCDRADEGYWRMGKRNVDLTRPLLVVVHPGDMTEVDASDVVAKYSMDAQCALAGVIRSWVGEIAILHRFSSVEFVEGSSRAAHSLTDALSDALGKAVLLCYGDDLETFAQDLTPFAGGRPSIVITGAYKDEANGCVDDVARRLGTTVPNISIHWSAYEVPNEEELEEDAADDDDGWDDDDNEA